MHRSHVTPEFGAPDRCGIKLAWACANRHSAASAVGVEVSRHGHTRISVRAAESRDLRFMKDMLYQAANRPGDDWPPLEESLQEPNNLRFWRGFPRIGDVGVIAEIDGVPVGAAWIRPFSGDELTGNDDPGVPVLVMAVREQHRGGGVGRRMMSSLVDQATVDGVEAINLTTREYLTAAVRLYESSGFRTVAHRGTQLKMRLTLAD